MSEEKKEEKKEEEKKERLEKYQKVIAKLIKTKKVWFCGKTVY